jgi:hypothetical protein
VVQVLSLALAMNHLLAFVAHRQRSGFERWQDLPSLLGVEWVRGEVVTEVQRQVLVLVLEVLEEE